MDQSLEEFNPNRKRNKKWTVISKTDKKSKFNVKTDYSDMAPTATELREY